MSSLKPIIFSFLLVGLFAIALVSFGIRLADINEANQSIGDDPSIRDYAGNLSSTVTDGSEDAQDSQDALAESPITLGGDGSTIDSTGGIWKTITTTPTTVWNLTMGLLLSKVFGGNSFAIALSIIGTMLAIAIIFAVVYWIRTGESEK